MGYKESELEVKSSIDLQYYSIGTCQKIDLIYENTNIQLNCLEYNTFEFNCNYTGFIKLNIYCQQDVKLYLIFDEVLVDEDIDFLRADSVNVIDLTIKTGEYEFESFEPYTLKYFKILVAKGSCCVKNIKIRQFKADIDLPEKHLLSDKKLSRIIDACVETYRQNAIDIFMDCPSRERAGWLCDSFFTARVAYDLTKSVDLETNFIENFVLADSFPKLPEGVLPMCYPADHYSGTFIPNWPLWFILELKEYLIRGGREDMVKGLKNRLLSYLSFLQSYENEEGLLEGLPGWVFIEWSEANDFINDVNFPTNMLYLAALKCMDELYDIPTLREKSLELKEIIVRYSYNGDYFVDNAIRTNNGLKITSNFSETCQYYAFFFGLARPKTHGVLWKSLVHNFGPNKKVSGICPSNTFIGFYLRLELLSWYEIKDKLISEIKDYFSFMAETTGTLWEHKDCRASCCHGFASYIYHLICSEEMSHVLYKENNDEICK